MRQIAIETARHYAGLVASGIKASGYEEWARDELLALVEALAQSREDLARLEREADEMRGELADASNSLADARRAALSYGAPDEVLDELGIEEYLSVDKLASHLDVSESRARQLMQRRGVKVVGADDHARNVNTSGLTCTRWRIGMVRRADWMATLENVNCRGEC